MEEASALNALEKIEAALARIEIASRRAAELGHRHERLKASVSRSLDEIDKLIARPPA